MKESKTTYAYLIEHMQNPSFMKVWDIAYDFVRKLPSELTGELHEALNRGVDVLDSEPLLQMYIYAFGKMHNAKLQYAFNQMQDRIIEKDEIQIIDYGCGQGLASICYHDYIAEHNPKQNIIKIVLIEPSPLALSRAELLCSRFYPDAEIVAVNKHFDNLNVEDIIILPDTMTLHLFSNILDVDSYNLQHLIQIVSKLKSDKNELVIVSPIVNEARTQRLKTFASNFKGYIYYENYLGKRQLDVERDWTCSILLCSDINEHELISKGFEEAQTFKNKRTNDWKGDVSIDLLRYSSEKKQAEDQFLLGMVYFEGKLIEKNVKLALSLWKYAGEHNNVAAIRLLGDYYSNPESPEHNYTLAIKYYTKAGKLKDVKSIKALIKLFQEEECLNLFDNEQIDVFILAAKNAIFEVSEITSSGSAYIDSDGVRYACKGLILTGSPYYTLYLGRDITKIRSVDKETYNINDGVRIINNGAFSDCRKLRKLEIPSSVNFIGASAFSGCYLPNSIILPNSLVYIGDQAFAFVSRSLDHLEDNAISYVISIPESVEMIHGNPFRQNTIIYNNSPHFKVIDNVLYSVDGKILISYCSNQEEFTIPDGVIRIGYGAFRYTKIKKIKFPQSIELIDEYAFSQTHMEASIIFPKSLKRIKKNAFDFWGVDNVDFTFLSDKTKVDSEAFGNPVYLNLVKVPKGSLSHYRSFFSEWMINQLIDEDFVFEHNLYLNSDRTEIFTTNFESYYEDINNVYIVPEGVCKIRDRAFGNIFYMESIKFPKTLKDFSEEMFNDDVEISKIYVPIGYKRFYVSKLPNFEDIIIEE